MTLSYCVAVAQLLTLNAIVVGSITPVLVLVRQENTNTLYKELLIHIENINPYIHNNLQINKHWQNYKINQWMVESLNFDTSLSIQLF